jgi:hypothetical protein
MDDTQRKSLQLQLLIFFSFGLPGAIVALFVYNSLQVLVFIGIAAFVVAKTSSEVFDYCKGEGIFQPHSEAGSRSSHDHALSQFSKQDDTNDHNRMAEDLQDYYEREQFREVQPQRSAQSHRAAQLQRPAPSRRTRQLQYPVPSERPVLPERSGQPLHPVPPRRTGQLRHPVPPRRSAHTNSGQ